MPELYFITDPAQAREAACWGFPLAHMAYGLGIHRLELTFGAMSLTTRGGWMVLTDRSLPESGSVAALAEQIRQECRLRRFVAVLADFEAPVSNRALAILSALDARDLPLIVPQSYAAALPRAYVLVDSAISGGDLKAYLTEQIACWPNRVCLSLRRLRMRFSIPCSISEGEALSEQALAVLTAERQSFFSRELGCRYITCRDGDGFSFVLFDDAASLQYKLQTAEALGIRNAVALYPELRDLLPELSRFLRSRS